MDKTQLIKILKKADSLKKGKEISVAKEFLNLEDKINSVNESVQNISEELKKKLSEELSYEVDEQKIVDSVLSKVEIPTPKDGNNYVLTDKDKKQIAQSIKVPIVKQIVEKVEVIHETPIVTNEIKEVAISDTRDQIVEKINTGKEDAIKIQASQISGLPKFTREIIREVGGHAGAYETPLVDSITGRLLSKNAQGAYIIAQGGGTVTSVSGTANRITSTGGTTPVIDIAATYIGQSSITTVGTLSAGAVPASLVTAGTFGSGAYTFPSTLVTTTSETVPLVIGGTAVGSSLSLQSTSGVGTTDFIKFLVGNNGGTEAARIIHNGNFGIGTSSPSATLDTRGTTSSTSTRVLNILGGTGIAGSTTGQDISIFGGVGKEYDTGSASVGAGGGLLIQGGMGGGLNDSTVTAGTYTAGLGGSVSMAGGAGGGVLDDPFDATVTLKGNSGGGFLVLSGAGGDASLGNSPSNSTAGNSGVVQFTTGFGGDSQSKSITIAGNSGVMTFSSNRGGNSQGRAAFTSSLGGNSGGYNITIGAGGTSTRSGAANAAATMTGGNSGAFTLLQNNAGVATGTGSGTAPLTVLGGTANNATITLGNGGNATGGTGSNTGGNGAGLITTLGKGGTGATANGTDGDFVIKDGYGNTVLTVKGNNTLATIHGGVSRLKGYTVATLPAGTQGDTAFVTDALAPTFLAAIVGGGTVVTPVFFNGTNWVGY